MTFDFEAEFGDALASVPDDLFDRSSFVGGVGPLDADVAFVGEAPGADEVEQGEPFVGNAGRVFDSLLDDVGVDRESVYVTNLVKVRPPENRDPRRAEIDAWWPVLRAELDRIDPAVVVTLGAFAGREVLDSDAPIGDLRGDAYDVDDYVVVPTYHPAATFYDDSVKAGLADDLRTVVDLASE